MTEKYFLKSGCFSYQESLCYFESKPVLEQPAIKSTQAEDSKMADRGRKQKVCLLK
jgi:hypothetical protein